ncbi:dihydroxyacetone kinase phosphoryl donor subunit DhaM [Bacillus sp. EB01]|uniref:dihydroxyacetone kinase phosphoryl donor subunit DhaM n=1 Tax=Bacillus sp. EB01 TaxID=1347086 RepID=UPI0005C6F6F5|nr:dihydroxyacetone kinase phosphoryl donor subunit DhaM [Bacillus sp. EB01]
MKNVGIVLISHSADLVKGLYKLLAEIQQNVSIATAGGTSDEEIGTDVFKIKGAIESVYSDKGVAIVFDLGSALINAEMAVEMMIDYPAIKIADAPLVEGAYAAVIQAGLGSPLDDVVAAAEGARGLQKVDR